MMFWREDPIVKYEYRRGHFSPEELDAFDIDRLSCERVPVGSVVLEVGCATGYMAEFLRERKGCVVIGVERDPEQAKRAEGRCQRVICGDIENEGTLRDVRDACRPYGGVDVVFASAILEHLVYPDRALQSFRGLLRRNGMVVATLPNIAHWSMRWRLLWGKWEYEDYGLLDRTHLRFFTFRTARQVFEDAGYRIVYWEIDPISGIPKLGSLLRKIPWLKVRAARPLQRLYRRFPNLFAFQTVFQAVQETI